MQSKGMLAKILRGSTNTEVQYIIYTQNLPGGAYNMNIWFLTGGQYSRGVKLGSSPIFGVFV